MKTSFKSPHLKLDCDHLPFCPPCPCLMAGGKYYLLLPFYVINCLEVNYLIDVS